MHGKTVGLDLGSRRTKVVLSEAGLITEAFLFESWPIDQELISAQIGRYAGLPVGTTGYHRKIAGERFGSKVLTEIKAFALGAGSLTPDARTVVDIGGQDAKVIHIDDHGHALDFEMNDRCAAGTGKFFEILARILGIPFGELSARALSAADGVPISSTCAVFAESEIIGHLAEKKSPDALARGVFRSVAERLNTMLQRLTFTDTVIMVGGGACPCLARELETLIHTSIHLPPQGEFFGALGAALYAGKEEPHD